MTKSSFDTPSPCLPAQPTARRPTMQTPLQPGPKVIFCVRGAISPLLSNIFLHVVLDRWFEDEVRPRMAGDATLVRFADDFVMTFETHHDAKRVLEVLGKRLGDGTGSRSTPTRRASSTSAPNVAAGRIRTARNLRSTFSASPTHG